jgi:hypothetical protein
MRNEIGPPVGNCPVQSEGYIDDHPYYFRSRGSHWTFAVSIPGVDPAGEDHIYLSAGYIGPWPSAGWIPVEEAEAIISRCVHEFREGKRGIFRCECKDCAISRTLTEARRMALFMEEVRAQEALGLEILKKILMDDIESN